MRQIIFIAQNDYDSDDDFYGVHILPSGIFFSVSFFRRADGFVVAFFKELTDSDTRKLICNIHICPRTFEKYDLDEICTAIHYVDHIDIHTAISRFIMDYIASKIVNNDYIDAARLCKEVRDKYDYYVTTSLNLYTNRMEGNESIKTPEDKS
ncbi:MAG: hypothetical protein HDS87_05040 [Bacteroidales bacterium]|nr:hypothetical protein [Bacteroidales bacterium]